MLRSNRVLQKVAVGRLEPRREAGGLVRGRPAVNVDDEFGIRPERLPDGRRGVDHPIEIEVRVVVRRQVDPEVIEPRSTAASQLSTIASALPAPQWSYAAAYSRVRPPSDS